MKYKFCALVLALLLAVSLTACRFEFALGGIEGGVHLELPQKASEDWHTASPPVFFCTNWAEGIALYKILCYDKSVICHDIDACRFANGFSIVPGGAAVPV